MKLIKLVAFWAGLILISCTVSNLIPRPTLAIAQQNQQYKVVLPQAFVFEQPSNKALRLRVLYYGAQVTLVDEDAREHWFQVEIDTIRGFMDKLDLYEMDVPIPEQIITLILPLISGGRYPL